MNINKPLVIFLVVLFTALASYVAIPQIINPVSEYDIYLEKAREYNEKNLCVKAMMEYENALKEEDSLDLRIEMVKNYEKGIENGEYKDGFAYTELFYNMVDKYKREPEAYEFALRCLYEKSAFEDCVNILYQAEDLKVDSNAIDRIRDKVMYECKNNRATYTGVWTTQNGYALTIFDGEYYILNQEFSAMNPEVYKYATPMINGYALVKDAAYTYLVSEEGVRQAYYPDKTEHSTGMGASMIAVKVDGKYSYYDLEGNEKFGEYDFAGRFSNGLAPVEENGKWHLITTSGEKAFDATFEDIKLSSIYDCSQSGLIFAKSGGKYRLYNTKLEQVGNLTFEDADVFRSSDQLAAVKIDGKWGYINSKGELVLSPTFDQAKSFSYGLGAVKQGEYWSFINEQKEEVIVGAFTDVDYFTQKGYCFVTEDKYWYYISRYYVERNG